MLGFALLTAIWLQLTDILTCFRAAEEHTYGMHVFPESDFMPSAVLAAASPRTQLTLNVENPSEAEMQIAPVKGGGERKEEKYS